MIALRATPRPRLKLPPAVAARMEPHTLQELTGGRRGHRLLRAVDRVAGGPVYIKLGFGEAGADMLDEAERLAWIGQRLPVPLLVQREICDARVAVVLRELPGEPAYACVITQPTEAVVQRMAAALRQVHALSITSCPFGATLERELQACERWVATGSLDTRAFSAAVRATPVAALRELKAHAKLLRANVFTHGDFCLPNVLVANDGQIAGIVDWARAGIADRHRDLHAAERSIRDSFGAEWVDAFYTAYGFGAPDPERLRYYALLEQFERHSR